VIAPCAGFGAKRVKFVWSANVLPRAPFQRRAESGGAAGTVLQGPRFPCSNEARQPMASSRQKRKVGKVMKEHKRGTLRSGSGRKVKSRKQAIAIALSESG